MQLHNPTGCGPAADIPFAAASGSLKLHRPAAQLVHHAGPTGPAVIAGRLARARLALSIGDTATGLLATTIRGHRAPCSREERRGEMREERAEERREEG